MLIDLGILCVSRSILVVPWWWWWNVGGFNSLLKLGQLLPFAIHAPSIFLSWPFSFSNILLLFGDWPIIFLSTFFLFWLCLFHNNIQLLSETQPILCYFNFFFWFACCCFSFSWQIMPFSLPSFFLDPKPFELSIIANYYFFFSTHMLMTILF